MEKSRKKIEKGAEIRGFSQVGTAADNEGKVIARDLLVGVGNTIFSLSVGTPEYISKIKEHNSKIIDPELQLDSNVLPVAPEVIVELDTVLEYVKKRPVVEFEVFLSEQDISEPE